MKKPYSNFVLVILVLLVSNLILALDTDIFSWISLNLYPLLSILGFLFCFYAIRNFQFENEAAK